MDVEAVRPVGVDVGRDLEGSEAPARRELAPSVPCEVRPDVRRDRAKVACEVPETVEHMDAVGHEQVALAVLLDVTKERSAALA